MQRLEEMKGDMLHRLGEETVLVDVTIVIAENTNGKRGRQSNAKCRRRTQASKVIRFLRQ